MELINYLCTYEQQALSEGGRDSSLRYRRIKGEVWHGVHLLQTKAAGYAKGFRRGTEQADHATSKTGNKQDKDGETLQASCHHLTSTSRRALPLEIDPLSVHT